MTLGEKIQTLRKQQNVSQEQLAEKMNVTRQAVSKWELGESLPDVDNIVRLSNVLNVSIDYLLKNSHSNDGLSDLGTQNILNEVEMDNETFCTHNWINFKGAVYPLATLIYLVVGMAWGLWHPGWVIFLAALIISEIVDFMKTGRLGISKYVVAAVLYVTLGLIFDWWRYAWLVFVAAWVFDAMVTTKPRKKKKKKKS